MREIRMSSDNTGVETGDSFLLSEGRTVDALFWGPGGRPELVFTGILWLRLGHPFFYGQIAGGFLS